MRAPIGLIGTGVTATISERATNNMSLLSPYINHALFSAFKNLLASIGFLFGMNTPDMLGESWSECKSLAAELAPIRLVFICRVRRADVKVQFVWGGVGGGTMGTVDTLLLVVDLPEMTPQVVLARTNSSTFGTRQTFMGQPMCLTICFAPGTKRIILKCSF